MSGPSDQYHQDADTNGWSLLYAPDTSLHPTMCAGCGNVFGADAPSCPWCGRVVARQPRVATEMISATARREEQHALSAVSTPSDATNAPTAAAATLPVVGSAVGRTAANGDSVDGDSVDGRLAGAERHGDQGPAARRWAGVIVAAGVMVAIATGVAIRGDDPTPSATGTSAAPAATTSTAASRPAAATSVASSIAATTATTPATSAAAPPATTAPPVTATSTIPASTIAGPGPSLSEAERRAVAVTQRLTDAIVAHDWARVRSLAPNNSTTDDAYERFWGTIENATLVPSRVTASPDGTFAVYTGVVNVTNPRTGRVTTLACGRYTVDLRVEAVVAVKTKDLRSIPGAAPVGPLLDELRSACNEPGL